MLSISLVKVEKLHWFVTLKKIIHNLKSPDRNYIRAFVLLVMSLQMTKLHIAETNKLIYVYLY